MNTSVETLVPSGKEPSGDVSAKTIRVRNWKFIALWLIAILIGIVAFQFQQRVPGGNLGPVFAVVAFAQLMFELLGIAIRKADVRLPLRPLKVLPIISIWRRKVAFTNLESVTFAGSWLGAHIMWVEGPFGRSLTTFQDRKARIKFIDGLKMRIPALRVYRYT